jgi:hypothetical protein
MKVARATMLLTLLTVAAGCGGHSGKESANAFMRRITTEFSRGQAGRLWADLVPSEQAIVSRNRYLACQENGGFRILAIKILDSYDEAVDVDDTQAPLTAVTVQVTSDDGVTTATMHAVRVGERWRWILQPSDLAAYRAGRCPRSSG